MDLERLRRTAFMSNEVAQLRVILDEAALHGWTGHPSAMRRQTLDEWKESITLVALPC